MIGTCPVERVIAIGGRSWISMTVKRSILKKCCINQSFWQWKRCILTSWESMVVHERPLEAMEVHGRFRLGGMEEFSDSVALKTAPLNSMLSDFAPPQSPYTQIRPPLKTSFLKAERPFSSYFP